MIDKANGNKPRSASEKEEIINNAAEAYAKFLLALKIDYTADPNSADTPLRVAKAYVNEIATGCFTAEPKITAFDNVEKYDGMVCQNDIEVYSMCSHHHLPFTGKAHVAYIPSPDGKVIGLSKIKRVVDWFARRPQIQEGLTMQIHEYIDSVCTDNNGVAVMIECHHQCCSNRGIGHNSTMRTARMSGHFLKDNDGSRSEFYNFVNLSNQSH